MEVYAYCFMLSHVHLIFRSGDENPSGLLRDFKGFTSKKIVEAIEHNPKESRKEWMLNMMSEAGQKKATVKNRQFWQQHNHPIELWSESVIQQKIK
ncbi:hypothetical protein GCM10009117_07120 [Gangjinia marincola]|uniref:Transposase n=2 Tax=Gangjinia marincola TaxID=578463 RepID=A0ABN1MEL0_9FLAO